MGFDRDALVVVEIARVDCGARVVRKVGVGNAPAIQVAVRVPQDRVQPHQTAQRPVAIGRVASCVIQTGKEQRRERVCLGGLALLGVAAAGVPPEPAAKRVIPHTTAEKKIRLALRGVNVPPLSQRIGGGARCLQEGQPGDEIVVGEARHGLYRSADRVGPGEIARAGVVPQPVEKDEPLVEITPTHVEVVVLGRVLQQQCIRPELGRDVPLVGNFGLDVTPSIRDKAGISTAERVSEHGQLRPCVGLNRDGV